MSNLSFNKNSFTSNNQSTLSKPIANDPTKLGRRTVNEIKDDMNSLVKGKISKPTNKQDIKDIQREQSRNMGMLKAFKEWNRK